MSDISISSSIASIWQKALGVSALVRPRISTATKRWTRSRLERDWWVIIWANEMQIRSYSCNKDHMTSQLPRPIACYCSRSKTQVRRMRGELLRRWIILSKKLKSQGSRVFKIRRMLTNNLRRDVMWNALLAQSAYDLRSSPTGQSTALRETSAHPSNRSIIRWEFQHLIHSNRAVSAPVPPSLMYPDSAQ